MWTASWFLACTPHSLPVSAAERSWTDPAARAFALRAWRAEARGNEGEAERSWRWVNRLDGGAEGALHRAEAVARLGLDAAPYFRQALALDPLNERAQLGLGLVSGAPLGPLLERHACRVAGSTHPQRAEAEALCVP